jgi:UDP-N-acetylglucosamine 2-epimerase (non-hydrolysing)
VLDVLRSVGITARPVDERKGVVITAHRATNVDDPVRLEALVDLVLGAARELGNVTFPVHPRTRERLLQLGAFDRLAAADSVTLLPPVPYAQMLELLAGARVVLTDSGGLQEEASWLGVPVVVLRTSTPRWEGVQLGTSVLVGLDVDLALEVAARFWCADEQARVAAVPCPYGDGHTSELVADALADPTNASLLQIIEPDFVGKEPPG